ncbi:MAG: hypothetical protein Q8S32_18320 [Burkholderiaceae bacterium]|nr:hypothetical protein [Burkholderiaceae bacterium]
MNNELTICTISDVGEEAVHVLTILAAHIDRLGRDEDAQLISGSAREVANVVMSILEQSGPSTPAACVCQIAKKQTN